MASKQRYVVLSTLVLAAIIGLALAHGFAWVVQQAGFTDPYPLGTRDLPLSTLLGYGLALAGAIGILKNETTRTLAGEIVDELSRVSWPSTEETRHATTVVIVAVLVCATYLGIFDAVWMWITDRILGIPMSSG